MESLSARALRLIALSLWTCLVAACGSTPQPRAAPAETGAQAGKRSFQVVLEEHFVLDYEVETKISSLDGKSCYAFITGSLANHSQRVLSRQSILDFKIFHRGETLFRDITNPRADIPPGSRAMFTLVDSPVHRGHCPTYDRIDVSLRKVFLN